MAASACHAGAADLHSGAVPQNTFFLRAADCAAAHKWRLLNAWAGLKTAGPVLTEQLEQDVRWGYAFAGTAYKLGLRKPLADDLLNSSDLKIAEMAVRGRDSLLNSCEREAVSLLEAANAVERFLVNSRARQRVAKLLESGPAPMAGPSN